MRTVIDELSLKINVRVKKDLDKTISSIANAITKLNKAVSDVSALKKYVNTLNSLTKKSFKIADVTNKGKSKATQNDVQPEYQEIGTSNKSNKKLSAEEIVEQKIKELEKQLGLEEKITEEEDKQNKKSAKNKKSEKRDVTTLGKLFRSVGRIAVYRAIRALLSGIVNSAKEGLENIRSVDTELDMSMKKMSQSFTSIKNSFASLLAPLIQQLEPVITKIADTFANIANRQAEARAALAGQTTYSKILTSDSEEYKKNLEEANASLLEFDKFNSLNKDKSKYTGVGVGQVDMSTEEAQKHIDSYNDLLNKANALAGTLTAIIGISFAVKFIKPLINGFKVLGKGIETIGKLGSKIFSKAGGVLTIGIISLITGIASLIANWKDLNSTARALIPTVSALVGLIAALVVAKKLLGMNWAGAMGVGAMVTGVGLAVGSQLAAQKYADGGIPKTGTLFYAGEAGAEIVSNTSSGKTGVTNIAQFKTAMVQALAEYGVAKKGSNSDTVLQINGKEFARATVNDVASALGQKYRVDFQPR